MCGSRRPRADHVRIAARFPHPGITRGLSRERDSHGFSDVWFSADGINWIQATPSAPGLVDSPTPLLFSMEKCGLVGEMNQAILAILYQTRTNSASQYNSILFTSVLFKNKLWILGGFGNNSASNAIWHSAKPGFTNAPVLPLVATTVSMYTGPTTALYGGNVSADGGGVVTERGICWSTSPHPTISGNKKVVDGGLGIFTGSISGLSPGVTYYVRAYAVNSVGTAYGEDNIFSTPTIATLKTTKISVISATIATSGGEVMSDGGARVTERGISVSTSVNPTIADYKILDTSGIGSITSTIFGLLPNTTYNVRAYATNIAGTAYGQNLSFTIPVTDQLFIRPQP